MDRPTLGDLRKLKWRAEYHGEVPNASAPGGVIDMWLLVDDESGDSIVSLGVPKGRSDVAGYIAACCGNPVRWVTSMKYPRDPRQTGVHPEAADQLHELAKPLADDLFALIAKHFKCDDGRQANGWVLNYAMAMTWFAFCGQLPHPMRGQLLFSFLQLATTDYEGERAPSGESA